MLRKILDSPWLYFSLAGLLAIVAVATQINFRRHARPAGGLEEIAELRERGDVNVVFILIDTLRADRLSAYGYERETSPTIDYLASTGVRFAHTQSQSSWTKASMASLWTGSYPRRIGVTRYADGVSEDALMPAEIFKAAGLRTAGIFRNGWVASNFGFSQGFDMYYTPKVPSKTPRKFERHTPSAHPLEGTDYDVTEAAFGFLDSHHHERFLMYVHYMDVHQYIYDVESGLFGTEIDDIYDNAIHWTDRNVNQLLAKLDQHGLMEKTLFVIASDHGEAFYEHGNEGHAKDLYREVTTTPFILSFPFRLEPGVVIEQPVENVDIWPTVLDLLGMDPLPNADGRSLVPLIEAAVAGREPEGEWSERAVFAELDQAWGRANQAPKPSVSVLEGNYRLIRSASPESVHIELYDQSDDPTEQRNIAKREPEKVKRLVGQVEQYLEAPVALEAPHVELDEMRIQQLRALGYVDLDAK